MHDGSQRIRDPSQLAGLSVRRLLSWRAPGPVVIEAAGTPLARVHEWERRLSQRLGACGCEHGGMGLLLGLALCLVYWLLRPGDWGEVAAHEWWAALALLSVASTAGKVMGLRVAQRELQRTAREIRAQWLSTHDTHANLSSGAGTAAHASMPRDVQREVPRGQATHAQRGAACCGKPRPR
jgi:hypothetical protein